jgi:hypothetical protein
MWMRRALLLLPASLVAVLAACGLSSTGTGENLVDDAGPLDAALPVDSGAVLDSGGSGNTVDAAPVVDASPTGFHCPKTGQPVTDCSQCAGNPLHCYLCGAAGTHYDVCVPMGSACLSQYGAGMGLDWCPCAYPSAAACPLPEQECNSVKGGRCVTCGENLTSGFQCKNGGTCSQNSAMCR